MDTKQGDGAIIALDKAISAFTKIGDGGPYQDAIERLGTLAASEDVSEEIAKGFLALLEHLAAMTVDLRVASEVLVTRLEEIDMAARDANAEINAAGTGADVDVIGFESGLRNALEILGADVFLSGRTYAEASRKLAEDGDNGPTHADVVSS